MSRTPLLLSDYFSNVEGKLAQNNLENLELITSYYLGLRTASPELPLTREVERRVNELFNLRRGFDFLKLFLTRAGSAGNLTPRIKEIILTDENPYQRIVEVNQVTEKNEANTRIAPFAELINNPAFQIEYLEYESTAHNQIVGALIKRLRPVVNRMRERPIQVTPSKQNTALLLYRPENVGKTFLSVDLRRANWTALQYWDKYLPSWEEFLLEHLPESPLKLFFIESKDFRQVTLGVALKKLEGHRLVEATQVMIMRNATRGVVRLLKEPFTETNDEMIWEWRQAPGSSLENRVLSNLNRPDLRVTRFTITEKTGDDVYINDYYEYNTGKVYRMMRFLNPEKIERRLVQAYPEVYLE